MKDRTAHESEALVVGLAFLFMVLLLMAALTIWGIRDQVLVDLIGCAKYVQVLSWVPWIHVC